METSEWAVRGTHEVSYSRPPVPGPEARRVGYCHGGFPRVLGNKLQLLCFFSSNALAGLSKYLSHELIFNLPWQTVTF